MPLHDWTNRPGWEGVHHLWITELLYWIKPQLPNDYRAYIGSAPTLAVGLDDERPDVGVRSWMEEQPADTASAPSPNGATASSEPDEEVAVATLDPATAIHVSRFGRLVAALELVSPRNKDRPASRIAYLGRYLGYLLEGAHLLLVDVHPRPRNFSFVDALAEELGLRRPACPAPYAVSYRVGEPAATGGHNLATWRRPLQPQAPLPVLPLWLTLEKSVDVDLEATYARAAAGAYLT